MNLKNTTTREDALLKDADPEIRDCVQRIDSELVEALEELDTERETRTKLERELEQAKDRIAELESDLEAAARGETS